MGLQNVLNIEPGSVLWTIITFLVVVWLIAKFGWKPILSGLKAREDSIRNDLDNARTEREKAAQLLTEYKAAIAGAKKEAAEIIQKAQDTSVQIIEASRAESKAQTAREIERAKAEIERESDAARSDLRKFVADLTARATSRLIGKIVDPKEHEKLILDAMKEDK
jgi:F-type H+-transporting ATPase subunit b